MPNWCENWVTFTGEPENITKLARFIAGPVKCLSTGNGWLTKLSFDQPPWEYGEPFISDLKSGESAMSRTLGFLDKSNYGYETMVRDLGTKWDFDLENIEITDREIQGFAQTAWSPPSGWFRMVCKHYTLEGELASGESGNDFGCLITIEGNEEHEYGSSYNFWSCLNYDSPEEFRDQLLDLNDEYPEYIENIHRESALWPKSWAEYKERFHKRTAQI